LPDIRDTSGIAIYESTFTYFYLLWLPISRGLSRV